MTQSIDQTGDGYPETTLSDDDGDGHPENIYVDLNGDGRPDQAVTDSDGDGITETVMQDTDGDGQLNIVRVVLDGSLNPNPNGIHPTGNYPSTTTPDTSSTSRQYEPVEYPANDPRNPEYGLDGSVTPSWNDVDGNGLDDFVHPDNNSGPYSDPDYSGPYSDDY